MKRRACIPASAVLDPRLRPSHLRTLLALGLHTDANDRCHVKVGTLAQIVGTHPHNVQRYLRELEQLGRLRRVAEYWPSGGQRENTYELLSGEHMSGGQYVATAEGAVRADCPQEEPVLEPVTTPAPSGPGEETSMIQDPSTWEDTYRSPKESTPPKKARQGPVLPKTPPTLNATTVAIRLRESAIYYQYGRPAPSLDPIRGTLARWHREGVRYKEINEAVNLCGQELGGMLDVPLAAYFMKHGFEWIAKAQQIIYERELPARIAKYREENEARLARIAAKDPGLRKYRASRFPPGPIRDKAEACGF